AATWHAGHAWFTTIIGPTALAIRIILATRLIAVVSTGTAVLTPTWRTIIIPSGIVTAIAVSPVRVPTISISSVIAARRPLTTIPFLAITLFPTTIIRTTGWWRPVPVTVTRTWRWAVPITRAWWRR